MPFTLVHGLIAYFFALGITKDKRYWLLGFIAGMLPDLDGFPILFDMELYYALHHELFHAPIYGIILGVAVALILEKFFEIDVKKSFIVFSTGFILHPIFDVLFTNWPVKLLWPFSSEQFSFPILMNYNVILSIGLIVLLVVQLVLELKKRKK